MKRINIFLTWLTIFIIIANFALASNPEGLLPVNRDGFETGDWRNFRPHYAGNATDWMRQNFSIIKDGPIDGNFSLRWSSDDTEHQWYMLSNAFYMAKPMTVSVDIRLSGDAEVFKAGLLLMESKEEFAGITVSRERAELFKKGNTTIERPNGGINILPGRIYQLSVSMLDDNVFRAEITEKESGRVLAGFESLSFIVPGALSFYVKTGAGSNTVIDFDNLEVKAADYKVPAGEYVRSPRFVALPRLPDVTEDEGNWVGGHSVMFADGEFKMWYRIRDNQVRGRGYGFARSSDGLNWEKYENNPLFSHHPDYQSNEKISVLKVDGLYRAWYAVDTGKNWFTAYATSKDGISWTQHGLVIDETYCKDVVVIYLAGTYYLYSIKDNTQIGVYTSSNGVDFSLRNFIDIGVHAHLSAFYEKKTGLFHLYSTAGFNGVNHAVSADGINFGFFTRVMSHSPVGLDDWDQAGVTYLSFVKDAHGHVQDSRSLPFYYQARNFWGNNSPGWLYHGGEGVVLGGKFEGLYLNIPAIIHPDQSCYYESFPFMVPRADGLSVSALRPVRIVVDSYEPGNDVVAKGILEAISNLPGATQLQLKAERLNPGKSYQLFLDQNQVGEALADKYGTIMFTIPVRQDGEKKLQLVNK